MASEHTHAQRVQAAFSQQAAAFEDDRVNRVFTDGAEWLFRSLRCEPGDVLLDVAAGTGHAARSLADRVRFAVAVDVTPEMLQAGKASAEQQGVCNVIFLRADALRLPFLDESFDVAISRFASHHIERPDLQLAEMARCLRKGGRLALADIVAAEDAMLAGRQNRIERLRDPSHARMLPVSEIETMLANLGLSKIVSETRTIARAVEPWLQQARTEPGAAEAVRSQLRKELEGAPPTGLAPLERDGELHYHQVWASVRARKPL